MINYRIGDLVWIPDGTNSYTDKLMIGAAIKGPAYGIVTKIFLDKMQFDKWLKVKVGKSDYVVAMKKVRKIED